MNQRAIAYIPMSKLVLTDINMPHSKKKPDISDLLPSVREKGILQNLLVRPKGDVFEIAAGRRRYFCLETIRQETGEERSAPCMLLEEGDDAAAVEASLSENVARQDADEMTQYETYARLISEGKTPADIARTFGLEVKQVEKRLALGNLAPAIRDLFRNEKIGVDEIRLLTLASARQQKEYLSLHKKGRAPQEWQLKEWICGGKAISVEVALFPLEDYKGAFLQDLFEEQRYFSDVKAFWDLQNAAIAARRDKYLAKEWQGVEVLNPGQRFNQYLHTKAAKKDGAKVFVEVNHDGSVKYWEGYLTDVEAKRIKARATRIKAGEDVAEVVTSKPELTQGQSAYVDAHRQAAARAALVQNPTVAFRLMVAHAISGDHNFRVTEDRPFDVEESLAANGCHQVFTAALALLDIEAIRTTRAAEDM